MEDPDLSVRSWACWALTQFAEFLQPEIVEHYEAMLPGIFQVLKIYSVKDICMYIYIYIYIYIHIHIYI